jgi:four helix bundle protein
VGIYEVASEWRDFGLRDQMQRSAVSIVSNIAEGCERGGKDFARFLRMALGSAAELRTQTYIARKIGLIQDTKFHELIDEQKQISKMLNGLIKSLSTSQFRPNTEN